MVKIIQGVEARSRVVIFALLDPNVVLCIQIPSILLICIRPTFGDMNG
jgi:hypothetical protein